MNHVDATTGEYLKNIKIDDCTAAAIALDKAGSTGRANTLEETAAGVGFPASVVATLLPAGCLVSALGTVFTDTSENPAGTCAPGGQTQSEGCACACTGALCTRIFEVQISMACWYR